MRLHHLALTCRDVEGLATFYAGLLSLPELGRHHDDEGLRSVWLQLEEGVLMVERGPAHQAGGWRLPAFRVSSADRPEWRRRLEAAGAGPVMETAWTLYGQDPEGNLFGLSHADLPALARG